MPRVITDKGEEFNVEYAWAPLRDGSCGIVMQSEKPFDALDASFSGLKWIRYIDADGTPHEFTGYNLLRKITKMSSGSIYIRLEKGKEKLEGLPGDA